ncbi:MAG: type II toxin-antitoxin system Phd/YefM family antitoxin [Schwartzia sp. (in: firmicutes)]
MIAVPSGNFLQEFTLLAERATEEGETILIQRPNGKHAVMMSLDTFNDMQKMLYQARQKEPSPRQSNQTAAITADIQGGVQ